MRYPKDFDGWEIIELRSFTASPDTPAYVYNLLDWADNVPLYLTVYQLHWCYGGPEEGGWYYTAYEFCKTVPITPSRRWSSVKDDKGRVAAYDSWLRLEFPDRGDWWSVVPGETYITRLEPNPDIGSLANQPAPRYE